MVEIRQLSGTEGRGKLRALADVLLDCVKGVASVSFMAALSRQVAEAFIEKAVGRVSRFRIGGDGPDRNWDAAQSAPSSRDREITGPAVSPRPGSRSTSDGTCRAGQSTGR